MKRILISFSLLVVFGLFYNVALADDKTPKPIPQYVIKITSPQPEETFQNSAQSITITVVVTPELDPEDKVVALVDGIAVGEPIHSTDIALPWLARGSHTLQVKVIQPKGRGAATDVITIFQQRTSKLLPPHG
ncbi:MAG TPA: hypothetical protein VGU44_01850 [Gammaproteobacteria bacterium]|nr:hypothetical protein [Gammaproteobacteria bacterium]